MGNGLASSHSRAEKLEERGFVPAFPQKTSEVLGQLTEFFRVPLKRERCPHQQVFLGLRA